MTKYPNLKSLNTFYKPHNKRIVLFILLTLLAGGVALTLPFASSQMIINLTAGKYSAMIKFSLILFVLAALVVLFGFIADLIHTKTVNKLSFDIRRTLAYKTINMNLSSVYEKGSGFFLERLSEDSREISTVRLNIYSAIIDIVINLGFIGYITVLNPWLSLIFAVGLAVLIFLEYFRVSRMLANQKKTKRALEKVKAEETEILKGLKEIKGIGAREAIIEKHSEASGNLTSLRVKRNMFNLKMQGAINLVKSAIDLIILLFAGLVLLPQGAIELAAVLVVYSYKGNIYGLIAGIAKIKDTYVNGELAAKRINDVVQAVEEETDNFGVATLKDEMHSIEFKNVSFSYVENRPILDNISFKIDSPGVYGFVGKSGSGKSTIFSLLTGFYKPTKGEIFINDTEYRSLCEKTMREGITPVLQDPYMFNDTIMNNIRFAKEGASDEDVMQACMQAHIHDEIMSMKAGYQTIIGENGSTISGGQKQRLEIARALLKSTNVMLFDEATSALDKANLEYINDLILELGKNKIIFVIAHRLGVMRKCDKVVVLDQGKILAVAHHNKLLETCDYYAELFSKSAKAEQKAD